MNLLSFNPLARFFVSEPSQKRVYALIDGQNLFHAVKSAYGYTQPNFDINALVSLISRKRYNWEIQQIRFYTGVPLRSVSPKWHDYWMKKKLQLTRKGVYVYTRPLAYQSIEATDESGILRTIEIGREKGIDIRIALDAVALAISGNADVLLLFSQDQDLSEVADEIRKIARSQRRWIKVVSAFPDSKKNRRGIEKTDWIRFTKEEYDTCLE